MSSESETATVETGLYVVGWLKRGPTGIVATNLHCAEETVGTFVPVLSFIPYVCTAGIQFPTEAMEMPNGNAFSYSLLTYFDELA